METIVNSGFDGSFTAFTNAANYARAGNRIRQKKLRPHDPTSVDFDIDLNFIPQNFLRMDINRGSQRHLPFATDLGIKLLNKARTWFIDRTFKVVSKPIVQLLTFHAYSSCGPNDKQFPLL
jgi:hypothetical protein